MRRFEDSKPAIYFEALMIRIDHNHGEMHSCQSLEQSTPQTPGPCVEVLLKQGRLAVDHVPQITGIDWEKMNKNL